MIVATTSEEQVKLEALYDKSLKNGVPGMAWANPEQIRGVSEEVNLVKGLFSGTTGILDISETIKKIEAQLLDMGAYIFTSNPVKDLKLSESGFEVTTGNEVITCDILVNAAGLFAVDLRKKLGLTELENRWVKGHYLKTNQKFYTEHLIYPIPPKNLEGLGVHSIFDFAGVVRFGPDTLEVSEIDYGMDEETVKKSMFPAVSAIFKNISLDKLTLDYAGIRPKVKVNGVAQEDFWIKGASEFKDKSLDGYIELVAIQSPGVTAAPAIAKRVVNYVEDSGKF